MGKHGHADGRNGSMVDVADRPGDGDGDYLGGVQRPGGGNPAPIVALSSNLHQLPSHRNDFSNADLGEGGKRAHWCISPFSLFCHWLVAEISSGLPGEFALPVTHV